MEKAPKTEFARLIESTSGLGMGLAQGSKNAADPKVGGKSPSGDDSRVGAGVLGVRRQGLLGFAVFVALDGGGPGGREGPRARARDEPDLRHS